MMHETVTFFLYLYHWVISSLMSHNSHLKFPFHYCIWFCVLIKHMSIIHVWNSEDNFHELVLSFYHMSSRNRTCAARLGGKILTCSSILLVSHSFSSTALHRVGEFISRYFCSYCKWDCFLVSFQIVHL